MNNDISCLNLILLCTFAINESIFFLFFPYDNTLAVKVYGYTWTISKSSLPGKVCFLKSLGIEILILLYLSAMLVARKNMNMYILGCFLKVVAMH